MNFRLELFLIGLVLIGCFHQSENSQLDTQQQIKNFNFTNKFSVTIPDCKQWGLPETSFHITYPDGIGIQLPLNNTKNPNYIEFFVKTDSVLVESLIIGYFRSTKTPNDVLVKGLLTSIKQSFLLQMKDAKVLYEDKAAFFGKNVYQLHLQFEVLDNFINDIVKYKVLVVLLPPEKNAPNGVLFMFKATGKSEIKDFTDFGYKGISAKIWQTFSFD